MSVAPDFNPGINEIRVALNPEGVQYKRMKTFWKKYKFHIDLLGVLFFAMGSIMAFIEYPFAENGKMKLFSAIVFGLMAIFKTVDLIEGFRKEKKAE